MRAGRRAGPRRAGLGRGPADRAPPASRASRQERIRRSRVFDCVRWWKDRLHAFGVPVENLTTLLGCQDDFSRKHSVVKLRFGLGLLQWMNVDGAHNYCIMNYSKHSQRTQESVSALKNL